MRLHSLLAVLVPLILPASAHADEPREPSSHWLARGYAPVAPASRLPDSPRWPAHSLAWPVEFQEPSRAIGNSMAEFQSYGDGPYYHGGCDLLVQARAEVRAPVSGRIEAGHYGYANHPDGSSTKFWRPWPAPGDRAYFEIAVITDDGYRFELHHLDESRLSGEVLGILQAGKGRVEAGAPLGRVIPWPGGSYHHTHYNIVSAAGTSLNPEFYSPLLPDREAPRVQAVVASMRGGQARAFGEGIFDEAPEHFAVAVNDRLDGGAFVHPPVLAEIAFEGGESFSWDFRERLAGADGGFPPLWDFFVRGVLDPSSGKTLATSGGYGTGLSVIRIPVPAGALGAFELRVSDIAGNVTRVPGRVGAPAGSAQLAAERLAVQLPFP